MKHDIEFTEAMGRRAIETLGHPYNYGKYKGGFGHHNRGVATADRNRRNDKRSVRQGAERRIRREMLENA